MVEMKGKGEQKTFWVEASPINKDVNRHGLMALQDEVQEMLMESTKAFDGNMQKMLEKTNVGYSNGHIPSPRSKMRLFKVETTDAEFSEQGKDEELVEEAAPKFMPAPLLGTPKVEKQRLRRIESASITEDSSVDSSSLETSSSLSSPSPEGAYQRSPKVEKQKTKCPYARMSKQPSVSKMYFI